MRSYFSVIIKHWMKKLFQWLNASYSLFFSLKNLCEGKRKEKERKNWRRKKVPTTLFLYIILSYLLKQEDFILSCDTQHQISFFSFIFITGEPSGTEQKRQKVKKKMTEGTLHSLLWYLWTRFSRTSLILFRWTCYYKQWKQVSVKAQEMGAATTQAYNPPFHGVKFWNSFPEKTTTLLISLFGPKTGRKA